MKISDLVFEPHKMGSGVHARVDFDNGYGASVVSGPTMYTSEEHPYEIAVFHGGEICYSTSVTNDVLGYLNERDANTALADIEALPRKGE